MLTITRKGAAIADVIASVRDVPARAVPYAASTALTRTATYAVKTAIPDVMRAVFDSPTAYTINGLRVEPSTVETLSARVMVKNESGSGVAQENFLFPEVEGGARKAKRFERALRAAGFLRSTQFAVPGKGVTLDANGNVSGAQVRSILSALQGIRGGVGAKGQRAGRGRALKNDLFVGKPRGGDRPDGIWRREGKRLRALFVFTDQPLYSKRLDFTGTVQQVALDRFRVEFEKALPGMVAKFGGGTVQ